MDFALTDTQRALQDTARKFAREVVRPKAAHYDESAEFPKDLISAGYELGLMNMTVPPDLGGAGLSHFEQALVAEELAWGCAGVATSMIANDLALLPILIAGTQEQKQKFVAPFAQSLKLGSFALTEPGAGSDVAGMSTTARRDGEDYIVNGSKCFITNGGYADQFTLFATLDRTKRHRGPHCLVIEGRPNGLP